MAGRQFFNRSERTKAVVASGAALQAAESGDGTAKPSAANSFEYVAPYNKQRPFVASAARLDLRKLQRVGTSRRTTSSWQQAAWDYYENISELQFAFNLVSQLVSRVTCHGAFVTDPVNPPVACNEIVESLDGMKNEFASSKVLEAARIAQELVETLVPSGYQSTFLYNLALSLCVPGEAYVIHNTYTDRYISASTDELSLSQVSGGKYSLKMSKSGGHEIPLSEDAYVARIWRKHPRFSDDAISSMRGVLDACEQFLLIDQAIRSITRSQLNAGGIYIPTEVRGPEGKDLETALHEMSTHPVEDESSIYQVMPLLVSGPAEYSKFIQRIELARPLDPTLIQAQDRAMERILRGIDVPKDVIGGLADIKYANAIAVDDNLFKAHIEPLILLICDALTTVYLQPALRMHGVDHELASKYIIWYNPSAILTRPDRSQAANEGFDRYLLSADAWRTARGFSDLDAPTAEELIKRLTIMKAQIPQDMTPILIEQLAPEFFKTVRKQTTDAAGIDPGLQQLLSGETLPEDGTMPENGSPNPVGSAPSAGVPTPEPGGTNLDQAMSGGEVSPNGYLPPRQ